MTSVAPALLVLFVGVLAAGLVRGLTVVGRRAGLGLASRRRLSVGVAAALALWLGGVAALARSGVLEVWTARPPRLFLVPLTAFAVLLVLTRTATFRALLAATPPAWPLGLQTFRVGVELLLWALHLGGLVPVQMTFEGRNFDVVVGALAPVIALAVAARRLGPRWVLAWNVGGLLMLVNVVGTALTSLPGPLHLDWPGAPLTEIARWPMVWIPGFLVPLAVFLHVVSIRQTLARLAPGVRLQGAWS